MSRVFKSEFKPANIHRLLFEFFSSWLLCIILLLFLMLLVFLGTLAQVEMGIQQAQKIFFDSLYFFYPIGSLEIPLPGAYTILSLLFVNLILGGLVRLKISKRNTGIIIIHSGVLYLLLSGLVSFHFSSNGFVRLGEGDSTDYFESWTEWDLLVTEFTGDEKSSFRIPLNSADISEVYSAAGHDVKVNRVILNSKIVESSGDDAVEGFAVKKLHLEKDSAKNVPSVMVEIDGQNVILSGWQVLPYVKIEGGKECQFSIVRRRYELPFEVSLSKFSMTHHPNTQIPGNFKSKVLVNGNSELMIEMNEPLRKDGIALFQSSWEKQSAGEKEVYYSTFSTVKNPADNWPLYACIVLAIGLLIHFVPVLVKFAGEDQ